MQTYIHISIYLYEYCTPSFTATFGSSINLIEIDSRNFRFSTHYLPEEEEEELSRGLAGDSWQPISS